MRVKYIVLSFAVTALIVVASIPAYRYMMQNTNDSPQIFITAAHIPSDEVFGYTLMYVDESRDTAYYLKDDYKYHYPEVGEKVYFGDSSGTVTEIVDGKGFYITTEAEMYQGLSGSRVKSRKGEDIGFISSVKGDKVLCICLK